MARFNPYDHFGYLTNRVSRLINKAVEPRLRAFGYHFPTSCIGVLADLWQKDGVTQKELGSSLIKTKSTVAKMLDSLESAKLIYKTDHPTDRRNKLIFLTDQGKELRSKVVKGAKKSESKLLANFSDDEISKAKEVLLALYKSLSNKIENQKSDA